MIWCEEERLLTRRLYIELVFCCLCSATPFAISTNALSAGIGYTSIQIQFKPLVLAIDGTPLKGVLNQGNAPGTSFGNPCTRCNYKADSKA